MLEPTEPGKSLLDEGEGANADDPEREAVAPAPERPRGGQDRSQHEDAEVEAGTGELHVRLFGARGPRSRETGPAGEEQERRAGNGRGARLRQVWGEAERRHERDCPPDQHGRGRPGREVVAAVLAGEQERSGRDRGGNDEGDGGGAEPVLPFLSRDRQGC